MSLRRFPFLSGVLVGVLVALFALGNLDVWLRVADAQVPFGAFRIMDGTHTQLARVNHTGQLAVDATVTVTTDNVNVFHQSTIAHVSSVTHVAAAGLGTPTQALSIRCVNTGATAFEACGGAGGATDNIQHIGGALHVAGTITGAAFHVQGLGLPGVSHGGVLTIQGITGMNALVVSQATASSLQMTATQTGTWTVQPGNTVNTSAWLVQVAHVSAVTHIASAGLALANQAMAVRCVDTGGTTFQACGGGADPSSVVQSSAWTIQAAHLVVISHIAQSVHIGGTIQGAQFHVQGLGLPGASHGGVLTIQGITGMNSVVVSQATASSLQMTATQTGTWTVQPGNTPNTTAWLVNLQHASSVVHIAASGLGTPTQALSIRCVNTGATAFESCGGTVTSDTINVFHQSTVAHVSSVTHMALMSVAGTALSLGAGLPIGHVTSVLHIAVSGLGTPTQALSVRCVNTGATAFADCGGGGGSGDAVNVFHQSTIAHVSSVTHVMVASHQVLRVMGAHVTGSIHVAGLTNVGSGAPGTGTTQMVCHSTLAIHVAAAAPGYTQIIHLTSSNGGINQAAWRIYICSIMVVSAHAQGFSLLEGTGTTCLGQPRHAVIGAWRPDDSVVLTANSGFSFASPFPALSTQVPGNNLCIGQTTRTSGGSISGYMSYRAGP